MAQSADADCVKVNGTVNGCQVPETKANCPSLHLQIVPESYPRLMTINFDYDTDLLNGYEWTNGPKDW